MESSEKVKKQTPLKIVKTVSILHMHIPQVLSILQLRNWQNPILQIAIATLPKWLSYLQIKELICNWKTSYLAYLKLLAMLQNLSLQKVDADSAISSGRENNIKTGWNNWIYFL